MKSALFLGGICVIIQILINPTNGFVGFGRNLHDNPWSPLVFDRNGDVSEEFITQRLDNFNPQNNRTFQMVIAI